MPVDNSVSFQRFTSVDPNIAQYGSTREEFELQRGNPDADPILSPMAATAIPETRLGLAASGSDQEPNCGASGE